jgi:hypothetical protein
MKTKEMFALVVRVIGVVCLVYLVRNMVNHLIHGSLPGDALYLVTRIIYVVLGAYLIRGAPHLVKFAYPTEPESGPGQQK